MLRPFGLPALASLVLGLFVSACTLPGAASNPEVAGTMIAATIYALQTNVSGTQTQLASEIPTSAATAVPTETPLPRPTATPQNPLVTTLALCWTGPGNAYVVVSSIQPGTRVVLLGIGSLQGWYVIDNPVYHNRCWIESKNLQIDPAQNLSTLQLYNPPPTPGPKITPVPTAT